MQIRIYIRTVYPSNIWISIVWKHKQIVMQNVLLSTYRLNWEGKKCFFSRLCALSHKLETCYPHRFVSHRSCALWISNHSESVFLNRYHSFNTPDCSAVTTFRPHSDTFSVRPHYERKKQIYQQHNSSSEKLHNTLQCRAGMKHDS